MKAARWSWLTLAALAAAVPGCLLVQPLDDAKSDAAGTGGSDNSGDAGDNGDAGDAPGSSAGKSGGGAGASNGGKSGGGAGAPSAGKGGAEPTAGASAAGGPPSGVDFTLFTGKWWATGGTVETDCTDTGKSTDGPDTTTYDQFDLGTTSDLIWDADGDCPLLFDVSDREASAQDGQTCSYVAATTNYLVNLSYEYFDFDVKAGDKTAALSAQVDGYVTDSTGGYIRSCTQTYNLTYSRNSP
ncbi:MAG: hypothetical protein ABW061_28005 [Polyangiaceae bacterium]